MWMGFFFNRSILKEKKMIQKLHEYFKIYLFEHGLVSRYQAKARKQTAQQANTEIHLHVWNGSSESYPLFCTRPCWNFPSYICKFLNYPEHSWQFVVVIIVFWLAELSGLAISEHFINAIITSECGDYSCTLLDWPI